MDIRILQSINIYLHIFNFTLLILDTGICRSKDWKYTLLLLENTEPFEGISKIKFVWKLSQDFVQ